MFDQPELLPWWFLPAAAFMVGAVIASWCGVVAERGLAGSATGRSVCVCGRQLSWWENVPVLGWVMQRGVSRCCGATIPARYVVTEAAMGGCCAAAAGVAGIGGGAVAVIAGGFITVWMSRRWGARSTDG